MTRHPALFSLILTALLTLPLAGRAQQVTVFAAASLRGVLEEVAKAYESPVTLSFGGSGTMARQVAAGAPADAVALASPLWMDWLTDRGILDADAPVTLVHNALVVIGPAGAAPLAGPADILPRLQGARLAMGQRDAVPAGAYAQTWLRAAGAWDALAPHLAETDNVRAALALVARGEMPLGVVYATDAAAEPRVDVLYDVPTTLSGEITYPGAALTPAGAAFLDHLQGDTAQAIFAAQGFRAP